MTRKMRKQIGQAFVKPDSVSTKVRNKIDKLTIVHNFRKRSAH